MDHIQYTITHIYSISRFNKLQSFIFDMYTQIKIIHWKSIVSQIKWWWSFRFKKKILIFFPCETFSRLSEEIQFMNKNSIWESIQTRWNNTIFTKEINFYRWNLTSSDFLLTKSKKTLLIRFIFHVSYFSCFGNHWHIDWYGDTKCWLFWNFCRWIP